MSDAMLLCFVAFHTEQIACVRLRKKVLARAKVLIASAKLSIPSTWDFSMNPFLVELVGFLLSARCGKPVCKVLWNH